MGGSLHILFYFLYSVGRLASMSMILYLFFFSFALCCSFPVSIPVCLPVFCKGDLHGNHAHTYPRGGAPRRSVLGATRH